MKSDFMRDFLENKSKMPKEISSDILTIHNTLSHYSPDSFKIDIAYVNNEDIFSQTSSKLIIAPEFWLDSRLNGKIQGRYTNKENTSLSNQSDNHNKQDQQVQQVGDFTSLIHIDDENWNKFFSQILTKAGTVPFSGFQRLQTYQNNIVSAVPIFEFQLRNAILNTGVCDAYLDLVFKLALSASGQLDAFPSDIALQMLPQVTNLARGAVTQNMLYVTTVLTGLRGIVSKNSLHNILGPRSPDEVITRKENDRKSVRLERKESSGNINKKSSYGSNSKMNNKVNLEKNVGLQIASKQVCNRRNISMTEKKQVIVKAPPTSKLKKSNVDKYLRKDVCFSPIKKHCPTSNKNNLDKSLLKLQLDGEKRGTRTNLNIANSPPCKISNSARKACCVAAQLSKVHLGSKLPGKSRSISDFQTIKTSSSGFHMNGKKESNLKSNSTVLHRKNCRHEINNHEDLMKGSPPKTIYSNIDQSQNIIRKTKSIRMSKVKSDK